jgi:hypothetical protein
MLHRVQVKNTSQHQLFIGDCVNQAFMVKLPLLKDINKKGLGPRNMSNGHSTGGNLSFGLMSPNV